MTRSFATALVVLFVHWSTLAAFLLLRPSQATVLERRDREAASGFFSVSSAAPRVFIADRPLYQWNAWHGGERTWVKALEVANAPSLLGAAWFAELADRTMTVSEFRGRSWVRAWAFLALSTVQWFVVGLLIGRTWSIRLAAQAVG